MEAVVADTPFITVRLSLGERDTDKISSSILYLLKISAMLETTDLREPESNKSYKMLMSIKHVFKSTSQKAE